MGRLSAVVCNGTTTRFYDLANDLLGEANSGGVLDGVAVTNLFDSLLRRTIVSIRNSSAVLDSTAYAYDGASRLHSVSDGVNAHFSLDPPSLYANLLRVTIWHTGPDGGGTSR